MTRYKDTTVLITEDRTGLETILSVLATAPKECLYGLFNEQDRRCSIYNTTNFVSSILRLAQDMNSLNNKTLREDLSKTKVVILETEFSSKLHRDNRYRSVLAQYASQGWTFYSDCNIVTYKLKESYRMKLRELYYVLSLENPNGRSIVVGVFKKYKDACDFKASHYNGDIITEIVVADNDWTRSW